MKVTFPFIQFNLFIFSKTRTREILFGFGFDCHFSPSYSMEMNTITMKGYIYYSMWGCEVVAVFLVRLYR